MNWNRFEIVLVDLMRSIVILYVLCCLFLYLTN
jgi:hypothetical protein